MGNRWVSSVELFIVIMLFVCTTLASFLLSASLLSHMLTFDTYDIWFEADIPRIIENMTNRWSDNERTSLHPLFPLSTFVPVLLMMKLGLAKLEAVRLFVAMGSGFSIVGVYSVCRFLGCRRIYAVLFSLLLMSSAGFMFWFIIPETHNLAMITVLFAMLIAVAKSRKIKVSEGLELGMIVATLSITVTNVMYGMLAALPGKSLRRWLIISLAGLGLLVVFWEIERKFFPSSVFLLENRTESENILSPESRGFIAVFISFFYHTIVMPAIQIVDRPGSADWPIMITQGSAAGSAGFFGLTSIILWTVLFLSGLYALVKSHGLRPLAFFLVAGLSGQLVLYWIFGNETFFYAGNFIPLLIVTASIGTLGKYHRIIASLAVVLLITTSINNVSQFRKALEFFDRFDVYHHSVAAERERRPADHWSRKGESIRMGLGNERIFDRGYHQLGGNFSPAFGSLGFSIWVVNEDGELVTTSVDIPREKIKELITIVPETQTTKVITETPYYKIIWSVNAVRDWTVELSDVADGNSLVIMVRSDGPKGGVIRNLQSIGNGVLVGKRWQLEITPAPKAIQLGTEKNQDWWNAATTINTLDDISGWGFARITLGDNGHWKGRLRDIKVNEGIDSAVDILR